MDELLRDVPSAVKSYGADGVIRPDQFFIRGFEVTSQNWRKDGYLDPTYMPRDPANMQRVDVLAGPASVLYGAAQPTGTWNVTTKTAQADAFAYGGFMTGSYGLQRYTFDVNTPLNQDGTILFRLNGAYQNGNTNVQSVFNERTFVAPTFTFVLDDDTSLTWSTEYQKDRFRMYQGVPAINGDPFAINRNTFTGNPNGDVADYTSYRNTLTFTKILSDNWTMKVGEMSLWYNTPSTTTFLDNGTLNGAGLISSPADSPGPDRCQPIPGAESRHPGNSGRRIRHWRFAHKLVARRRAGLVHHEPRYIHDEFDHQPSQQAPAAAPMGRSTWPEEGRSHWLAQPIPFPTRSILRMCSTIRRFDRTVSAGSARTWLMSPIACTCWSARRFDYMTQEYARSDTILTSGFPPFPFAANQTHDSFNQFSPRAGVTYDLIPETVSVYAMYSHSFTPSVGVSNFSSTVTAAARSRRHLGRGH